MHGTKPTYKQRKLLAQNGILDSTDWVYMGTHVTSKDGRKSLSKEGETNIIVTFKNKVTGEMIRLEEK